MNLIPKRAGDESLTELTGQYISNTQLGGHVDIGRRCSWRWAAMRYLLTNIVCFFVCRSYVRNSNTRRMLIRVNPFVPAGADDISCRAPIAQNDFIAGPHVLRSLSFSFADDCEDHSASPVYGETTPDRCNLNGEAVGTSSAAIIDFQPYLERRRYAAKSGGACGQSSAGQLNLNLPYVLPFMWLTVPAVRFSPIRCRTVQYSSRVRCDNGDSSRILDGLENREHLLDEM